MSYKHKFLQRTRDYVLYLRNLIDMGHTDLILQYKLQKAEELQEKLINRQERAENDYK